MPKTSFDESYFLSQAISIHAIAKKGFDWCFNVMRRFNQDMQNVKDADHGLLKTSSRSTITKVIVVVGSVVLLVIFIS
jgi:hypothetical protein